MSRIIRNLLVCALALSANLPIAAYAATEGGHTESIEIDLENKSVLQRGAKYFVNYCQSCHSATYMRYSRLAEDLEIDPNLVEQNLIFGDLEIGDTMTTAMPEQDAAAWFGNAPPDLTLVARSHGVDWLYSYLKNFYLDPARPQGVNNLTYPDVAMPHVLGALQGWQKPVYEKSKDANGERVISHLELVQPGILTPAEYDRLVRELVTFLAYVGEPALMSRAQIGTWVILFLGVLLVLSYLLKKEYWKDVH
ncbi:MAG: cytochrome c1 [Gammaproteobacteria bacterium]